MALVPLEQAALAAEVAARNSARILSVQFHDAAGQQYALQHVEGALKNHGIDPAQAQIDIRCYPDPDCTVMGETLTVTVRVSAPLPLLSVVTEHWQVPVESSATFPRGMNHDRSRVG